jgi:enoyl-CoA hydratase
MVYEALLYEKREGLGTVTLNRPAKLNTLNGQMVEDLLACFRSIQGDQEVRVVILTGAGEKAFTAGVDIAELAGLSALSGKDFARRGHEALCSIESLGKPVLAAVNGYALGGGCEMAMACTLRLASENARFALPEVKLGLIPGYGGTQRLPRFIGRGRALELILSGEQITAQQACEIGLVNHVVPPAELIPAAENLARKIMANAPLALKYALEAVQHGLEMTLPEGLFLESNLFGLCCSTADMKEGTRAFLEKRPPKFEGR